jgi:hypothetical protein
LQATTISPLSLVDSTSLPKVFILGEHEAEYEALFENYSTALLEICNDDMDEAFDKWLSMLEEMESYANSIDYDIKGIKVWLNVFWEKDGTIRHIAYHLKANSRNIVRDELTAFFTSFMNHYKFPKVAKTGYSHYGSASFPTFARKLKQLPSTSQSADSKKATIKNSAKDGVGSKY